MDQQISYGVPLLKVDTARRIVSGWATLNNVDSQKDIVTTESSVNAFSKFRGNVRELHERIAAGKLVDYGVTKYFDKMSNKVYDGIFVRAYISKGAPNTWEKVLDGTLNGFSIGGEIVDWDTEIDENGDTIRVIKEYTLTELSLVDNPANPLANIVSVEKSADFYEDMMENTFEGKEMNDMPRTKKSAEGVVGTDAATTETPVAEAPVVEEPVAEVAETVEEAVEPVVEEVVTSEDPKAQEADETLEENVESADPVSEADSDVLASAINEIKAALQERDAQTASAFAGIVDQLKELKAGIDNTKASMQEELASVKSTVSDFDKRVAEVEADTAVRKSGDLGEVAQVQKASTSKWGGVFLTADL
jgi:hypothetical protein